MALLFVLLPIVEIYAWYEFIQVYSFWDAFLFCITTGLLGMGIISLVGRAALKSMQESLRQNQLPESMVMNRGVTMMGGIFLIIPGLFSKFFGALLILPGTRHLMVWYVRKFMSKQIASGSFRVYTNVNGAGFSAGFSSPQPKEREASPRNLSNNNVVEIKPQSVEHKPKND